MIDLHLHTTASDGRCTPGELVERVVAAGLTVIAVTDHDTTAAVQEVQSSAAACGVLAIAGIEITAVDNARDVHVLGYFFDPAQVTLASFLARQRLTRIARVEAIADVLARLGMPIDVAALLEASGSRSGGSVGRPQVARAMVAAGYVADTQEAFDKWLANDGPGFVARTGAPPEEVIAIIHGAGGLASLAHPGRSRIDARIPALCEAGLDAIEVYHSDHDAPTRLRYQRLARELGLLTTGGSDFHGDPAHGLAPGGATLPANEWMRLQSARHRHAPG